MEWQDLIGRVDALLTPLSSGEGGAGIDARYEREYDALRIEVAKLDAASGGTVDWGQVIALANGILSQKSKDILAASHLALGLYQTSGLPGLTDGLLIVAEISDRFWENAFPPVARIRGRASAMDWLVEKVTITLGDTPVTASDARAIVELEIAAKRFASVMNERYTDPAPAVRPLLDAITRLRLSVPEESIAAVLAPPAPPEPAPAESTESPEPSEATRAEIVLPSSEGGGDFTASSDDAGATIAPPSESEQASVQAAAPEPAPLPDPPPAADDPLSKLDADMAEWLRPIRPDAPGGDDAKHDLLREAIVAEVLKLDSASGGAVDWRKVAREGRTLLQEKSKDYLIACYLAYAFTVTLGVSGLIVGLAILDGLLRDYWETGFPPVARIRGRANAFGWLIDKLGPWFEHIETKAEDREEVELLELITKRFTARARDRFAGEGPGLSPLTDAVQRLVLSIPQEAPPPPPPPPPSQSSSQSSSSNESSSAAPVAVVAPSAPSISTDGEINVYEVTMAVTDFLSSAGRAIGNADRTNAIGVRMRVLSSLMAIEKAPPAPSGSKTVAAGPPQHLPGQLEQLMGEADPMRLLREAESAIANTPLWLDAHRAAAVALERLDAKAARADLIRELRRMIEIVPGLEQLQFRDGLAFASPATREWLDSEVRSSGGGGGGGSGGVGMAAGQAASDALALALAGKLPEAHKSLDDAYSKARSARERFMIRMATARICAMEGAADVALGIFDDLVDEIEARRLDEWDPELVSEALVRCYETLTARKDDATISREKSARVLRLLGRVDPQAAVRLSGSKKR